MTDEKESKPSLLAQIVEEEVQKAISHNLKLYKVGVVAFATGFALFIIAGLLTNSSVESFLRKADRV